MGEKNTVAVKIYGQDYSISSEKPREYIIRVADYVDGKMREISGYYRGSAASVAVLAAATITDELLQEQGMKAENLTLKAELDEARRFNEVLRSRVEEMNTQMEENKSVPEETQKLIAELEAKCRDIESNFFDLQMENIKLKNENENLKSQQYR